MRGCRCGLNTDIMFWGVTQEWISSVFEMSDVFWIVVLSSFSSWDEMKVRVKLLAYDVWAADDDKTDFFSVGVDIFDWLYLKERPISLPMVTMSTIKQIHDKCDYVRNLKNRNVWKFWLFIKILTYLDFVEFSHIISFIMYLFYSTHCHYVQGNWSFF